MDQKLLDNLKEKVIELEAANIIAKIQLDVVEKSTFPGAMAGEVEKQKAFLQSQLNLNQITVANLKEFIKKEEGN